MKRLLRSALALSCLVAVALAVQHDGIAQTKVRRIGLLFIQDLRVEKHIFETIRSALRKQGWVEGENIAFEFRDAGGDPTRFAEAAEELVRLKVDVLLPIGPPAVRAAAAATHEIPIVAHDLETDPVIAKYAQSYSRPGGNLTGLFLDSPELAAKWLELLREVRPKLSRISVLWDPTSGVIPLEAVREKGPALGISPQALEVRTPEDIDNVQSRFQGPPQAVVVLPSPMMYFQSAQLAQVAQKARLPATSMFVPFAEAGGLIAYGPELPATFQQCAKLVDKVLKGAKPGDLPIERPTTFRFVVNMKTAKAFGIKMPESVLQRADQVIK